MAASYYGRAAIAHPTLTDITYHGLFLGNEIAMLSPEQLPALRSMAIYDWNRNFDLLAALAETPWPYRLDRLHLELTPRRLPRGEAERLAFTEASVDALRTSLADRKLPRLELVNVPCSPSARDALAALCSELVAK
jgi:hypothetical protein